MRIEPEQICAALIPCMVVAVIALISTGARSCAESDNRLREVCVKSGRPSAECVLITRGHVQ